MKFTELTPNAKAYAMARYNESQDYWYETTIEQAKEDGKALGFEIDNIVFSGFHSQGDGASWTGQVDLGAYIDANIKDDDPEHSRYMVMRELIRDNWIGHLEVDRPSFIYSHSGTMKNGGARDHAYDEAELDESHCVLEKGILAGANVRELYMAINGEYLLFELCELAFNHAKRYADEIYKRLEADYDHYSSEEVFAETAEINDWDFDNTGRIQ
jgi:hypothetical protein